MKSLIDSSPFKGKSINDTASWHLTVWQPETIYDIGCPGIASNGIIRVLIASIKDGNQEIRKLKLLSLPLEWQAVTVAKMLAWSRYEPDTLPTADSIETIVAALRDFGDKMMKESTITKEGGWYAVAVKYLKHFLDGKCTAKEDERMACFLDWNTLPNLPLNEKTNSVANSAVNEPSGKKRKLSIAPGSDMSINHPDHALIKYITRCTTDMTKEVDKYVTENESLNAVIREKDEGYAKLLGENERMKTVMDEREKELNDLRIWHQRIVNFVSEDPKSQSQPEAEPKK